MAPPYLEEHTRTGALDADTSRASFRSIENFVLTLRRISNGWRSVHRTERAAMIRQGGVLVISQQFPTSQETQADFWEGPIAIWLGPSPFPT